MPKIISVFAREIIDSRGNPTVEAEVTAENAFGRGVAPSGASTGIFEALELRDGGKRFGGKGVQKAVSNVNKLIAPALKGMDVSDYRAIDARMLELDGTENKSKLGANATTAVSMAVFRAAACAKGKTVYELLGGKTLPVPFMNIINGGKHAGNGLAIQEFMIAPKGIKEFGERLRAGCEIYHTLKAILLKKYGKNAINVGDEGGFAPPVKTSDEALDAIVSAIEEAGYAKKVFIGMDAAASSFYDKGGSSAAGGGSYSIDGKKLGRGGLIDLYGSLLSSYPLISVEDPLEEEDFNGFAEFTKKFGNKVQVVGDDLLVRRIRTAIAKKSVNALLLKINQIGTVSESLDAAALCKKNGLGVMVSHRSGETEDTFIADFSVGIGCGQIKTGAPARAERTAKYNQLLRIAERVG
jgi:enolase